MGELSGHNTVGIHMEPVPGGWRIDMPAGDTDIDKKKVKVKDKGKDKRTEETKTKTKASSRVKDMDPNTGTGTDVKQTDCSVLLLEAGATAPSAGQRLLHALAQQPLELAALQEGGAPAIAGLLPQIPPWETAEGQVRGSCSCAAAEGACGHVAQAASRGAALWRAATPEQRLKLLGWTREALLAAALAAWAGGSAPAQAKEALRAALGPRGKAVRPSGGGPNLAEWLAEMADQGSMHAPGPRFHDVQIHLDVVESAAAPAATPAATSPARAAEPPTAASSPAPTVTPSPAASSSTRAVEPSPAESSPAPTATPVPAASRSVPAGSSRTPMVPPASAASKSVPAGTSAASPAAVPGPDPVAWARLLPGVPGAAKGLGLVAGAVMQQAEEQARPLRKKLRREERSGY